MTETPSDVCIVLHDLRGGGAEHACLRLAQGMIDAGRRVEIALIRGESDYSGEVPKDARISVLGAHRVSAAIPALARHFRARRPRSILSALTHVNIVTILAARLAGGGARTVVSERNQISKEAARAATARQRGVYRAVPFVYRGANAIVAVSEGVAHDLRRFGRLPEARVRVIHNPVYDTRIDRLAEQGADHPWLKEGEVPFFLSVGRLSQQKGFDTLLAAFRKVREKHPARLVILGEGEDRGDLAAYAAQNGFSDDLAMPGFVGNPYPYMSRAAAYVLSSRWEGFPNALVEAMACGTTVIATNCPSGPQEILDGGRYGRLVPVDDVEALAVAMQEVLSGAIDTGVARTRARSFDLATAARRYLETLEV